jgi:hypothetical protein
MEENITQQTRRSRFHPEVSRLSFKSPELIQFSLESEHIKSVLFPVLRVMLFNTFAFLKFSTEKLAFW